MKLRMLHLLAISALALPGANAQMFFIDQQNDPQPVTQKDNVAALTPGQTFRPTLTGIDFADFVCNNYAGIPGQLSVQLRNGIGGSILGTSSVVDIPGNNSIDYYRFFFPSQIALTPGQTYALEVVQVGGGTGWICERLENNYADGTAYWDGVTPRNYDYNFREGIVVPEPGSWALVSFGVAACLGCRSPSRFMYVTRRK